MDCPQNGHPLEEKFITANTNNGMPPFGNKNMKWYKKQIDKLKQKDSKGKEDEPSFISKKRGNKNINNPVAQRNRNRPKTDLY